MIFAAAQPHPTWHLLDRYLIVAEAEGLRPLICITKADLMETDTLLADVDVYRRLGYPVVITSVRLGTGLDELAAALRDKLSVFVGKSGVGKTSLLNVLQPGLGLAIAAVEQLDGLLVVGSNLRRELPLLAHRVRKAARRGARRRRQARP